MIRGDRRTAFQRNPNTALITTVMLNWRPDCDPNDQVTIRWRSEWRAMDRDGSLSLQWRHDWHDGVSNHHPCDCLLNRLFRRRSKKTSKRRVTGLCVGNSPVIGEFPAQRTSNAGNVSIWWRHHGLGKSTDGDLGNHGDSSETSDQSTRWEIMALLQSAVGRRLVERWYYRLNTCWVDFVWDLTIWNIWVQYPLRICVWS